MEQKEVLTDLLTQHEAELKGFIRAFVRDRAVVPNCDVAADDVFQDVAFAILQNAEKYNPKQPFVKWARGIAVNMIRRIGDREKRLTFMSPETIEAIAAAYDRTQASTSHQMEALRECIQRLDAESRDLLDWKYKDGLKTSEIGIRIQRAPDTVRRKILLIREGLKKCIEVRLRQGAQS